jgi:hypothetical protein
MNNQQETGGDEHTGGFILQFITYPARPVRLEHLARQGPAQTRGRNTDNIPTPRDQGYQITRISLQPTAIPREESFLHAILRPDIEPGQGWVGQQGKVAQCLVKPATQGSDYPQLAVASLDGIAQGQLKIGLVFIAGVLAYFRTSSIKGPAVFIGQ